MMKLQNAFGISIVGAFLAIQLMFLPTRSLLLNYSGSDRPRMTLPVASQASSHVAHSYDEISWTKTGGWVASGIGSIKENNLEAFLKDSVQRTEARGLVSRIRIRIPSDASAREFIYLTKCMESAGVQFYNIAVTRPNAPWI